MAGGKRVPQRKCTGCQMMKDKKDLIRIVREAESGSVSVDITGRRNGRGCYICRSEACFAQAKKSHGLERSLKCTIPAETWEELSMEIKKLEGESG